MMLEVFEAKKAAELPFQKIQHAFQILKSSEDFSFDDKDERLSNFLILMASLYSFQRKEKICFISPTYFYAQQAALMGRSYLKALKATKESDISIVVPGMGHFHDTVNASNVVFMHGKDFSDYLSVIWKGRKIVQIFPDVDVPVDPIKRSYCSRHDSD
jgi:hypothetical protein